MGNEMLAEQFSVTNPQKAKNHDHIEYTLTVLIIFDLFRVLMMKECLKLKEDIKNSLH